MRPSVDENSLQNRLGTVYSPVIVTTPGAAGLSAWRWWTSSAAVIVLVILGIGFRTYALAGDRNLWIDESMLALNLVQRSPAQLLEPLDLNQGAPVGFLLLTKAVITQLGVTERTFRLVPFLGSILGLMAFAWLAPRLLPRPAAILGLGLLTVSPYLISYSAECKQYATDAALTVGLFAAAVRLLRGAVGRWHWVGLGAAGAVAVWFSHPAAFVLGGIGTALLAEAMWNRDRRRFLAAAGTVAAWVVSFGVCYLVSLRHLGNNQFLLDYWNGHFLSLPPKGLGDLAWLLDHFFAPFGYPAGLAGTEIRSGGIAAVLFIVGVWGMWKERWPVAVAIVLPGVLALLASGFHKYPFAGRLLLFLVPIMVLGVARGAWMIGSSLRTTQPVAAVVLLGVLIAAPCLEAYSELRRPMRVEQLNPLLAKVRQEWRPGDRMYVYYGAAPAFAFYTRNNPFPADAVLIGREARENRTEYREQLVQMKGLSRVWLVFSHRHKHEESDIRAHAEGLGRCEQVEQTAGAAAYLFNFAVAPETGVGGEPIAPDRESTRGAIIRGGDR